jgi:membrane fusion protein (multidrug efflux system)
MDTATLPISTLPREHIEPSTQTRRDNQQGVDSISVPSPARKPRRKQITIALIAAAFAIVLSVVGIRWWNVARFTKHTDDAYVGGDVTVIAPKVAGFVAKVCVMDNQPVHAGDLLVKLDDRDFVAAAARAEASVAVQRAALMNIEASRRLQESIVAQAQASVAFADADVVRTHQDEIRFTNLLHSGAVSVQDFDKAAADYKKATAAANRARAGVIAAQRELDVIETRKQQTQAALEQAKAERDLARLNLSYTELRAPIDATVGNRSAKTGAYATIGSQLISLVPARGLWVDANFKESQLETIRPGAPATVHVDSISDKAFHGRVVSIAPATGAQFSILPPENATGNFTRIVQRVAVRIMLDDEAEARGQLRPGLSVIATVDTHHNSTKSEVAGL